MANELEVRDIGEDITLTATFADNDSALYDPATVTFEWQNPDTNVATLATWTAAVPGSVISKISLGEFRASFRPTVRGYWHWRWEGNSATLVRIIQSDEDTSIPVRPDVF